MYKTHVEHVQCNDANANTPRKLFRWFKRTETGAKSIISISITECVTVCHSSQYIEHILRHVTTLSKCYQHNFIRNRTFLLQIRFTCTYIHCLPIYSSNYHNIQPTTGKSIRVFIFQQRVKINFHKL